MEIIRTKYLNWLNQEKDRHFIKVLTGIRRVGKSTILEQFKRDLFRHNVINKQIHTYDFNNKLLVEKYTWKSLLIEIKNKSIKNKTNYVFLDEVQEINEFEKTIISLFEDKNVKYDIYITGSNSSMFSKEMISLFTGRTVEIYVSPFSYNEILKHNLFNTSDKGLPYHQNSPLNEYILKSGLGINIQDYQKDNFVYKNLEIVVDGTITKDIKNRHKLRHIDGIEKVIRYIFINIGRIVNANNLENFLKSNKEIVISKKTLLNYFRWIEESFLLHRINYFDVKGKKVLNTKYKYYCTDLGIITNFVGKDIKQQLGYRIENLVFLFLLDLGYTIYAYESKLKEEVDFIIIKNNEIKYVQVTYELNNDNFARETKSLLHTTNAYKKIILTLVNNATLDTRGIKVINIIDWLTEKIEL